MRCQKARSYLSAYCNQELAERATLEMRGHLAGCADCRAAERSWLSLREATRELPVRKVSSDFNARLLNRLAEERFAETRQSIPQPSSLGWLRFRQFMPALAGSAAVAFLAATGVIQQAFVRVPAWVNGTHTIEMSGLALDDSYLTVQPGTVQKSRMGTHLHERQTLQQSLALSDRVSNLSRGLRPSAGFGTQFASANGMSSYADDPYQVFRGRALSVPGTVVMRREIGFNGQTIRIYLMPSPDSQSGSGEGSARY